MEKKTAFIIKIIIFSCIFIAALSISLIRIAALKADNRFVFLFESLDDDELHLETRYVNTVPGDDDVTCFVKELLLGPMTNRYRPLFSKNTTVETCFIRDGILYINFSEDALLSDGTSSETEKACSLFKENIRSNFDEVVDTQIFIAGIEAYKNEESLIVTGE